MSDTASGKGNVLDPSLVAYLYWRGTPKMTATAIKTYNRGKLLRLAKADKLELADSYHFDDMMGESRTQGQAMPVAITPSPKPEGWAWRTEGVCWLFEWDFRSSSGSAWENPNGTVTLYVHSNSNYTFRIKA